MTIENKIKLLETLAMLQNNTAPINLSIGSVSDTNMVQHDTIIIHDAPPRITEILVRKGYMLSITKNGVQVEKF